VTRLRPFQLHEPGTVEEATRLLEEHGDEAVVYAGGTELLLVMKLGYATFKHLIDVKGIAELQGIEPNGEALRIGAAVTHREIERSPTVRESWPALAEMERNVANLRVRGAGTLGGNLCFSDPHSDPSTFLLAADATLVARRGGNEPRRIAIGDFVLGPYRTALEGGELLTGIEVPSVPSGAAIVHRKLALHERPAATVTCLVRLDSDRIAEARIAVGSVGAVPVRAPSAEALLMDSEGPDVLRAAGEVAAEASGAVDDAGGSAEYKRQLVRVLVERALREALEEAI
jgi:aerobic carbon-monoxide dehydrogenase medium subunit